jgi:hypothetical protein
VQEPKTKPTDASDGGVSCARCSGRRWPLAGALPHGATYVCQRCREALAGGNAIDPVPTAARRAARAAAGDRLQALLAKGSLEPVRASRLEPTSRPRPIRLGDSPPGGVASPPRGHGAVRVPRGAPSAEEP